MDHNIKALVDRYPNLRLQVNLGNRHRIIHRHIDRGSLWVYLCKQAHILLPQTAKSDLSLSI